jgi:transcriptional regulator with XRE-family HTH domain
MLLRNLGEVYKKGLHVMSDLYSRIEKLCAIDKITITTMCKESGASRASLSDLKMGRKQKLSAGTLDKIANYFDTTVDYLLGRTDDPENSDRFGFEDPAGQNWDSLEVMDEKKPLVNDDEELTEYLEVLKTRPEMRMLFQLSKDATKEDVEAAVRIIEALRNK